MNETINHRLGWTGIGTRPLRQYIQDYGVTDPDRQDLITNRLYNYRHRHNHTRRVLTQKELVYIDKQIASQFAEYNKTGSGERETPWQHLSVWKKEAEKVSSCPRGLHDEPCNCQDTRHTPEEPAYNYITLTDHLEKLLGKTVKHETFPLEGVITNINNETITIKFNKDFAGEHTTIGLSEMGGFLIKEPIF
jgi:hypothetical protein